MRNTTAGLIGTVEYRSDLFEATTITRMLAELEVILQKMSESPDAQLSEVMHLLDEQQKQQQAQDRKAFRNARRSKFGSAAAPKRSLRPARLAR